MAETDPRDKYRVLPPTVASDDMVPEVDTSLAEVEQSSPEYDYGSDPYLRITGWKQP